MNAAIIIVISAFFTVGVAAGYVFIFAAAAIRREDREFSLSGRAPDKLSRRTRRLIGISVRAGHAAKDLQEDSLLNDEWLSANSQIEDTYRLMGPPPSGGVAGQQDE